VTKGTDPSRLAYLENFLMGGGQPKKDEYIPRKYSKRLKGANPY
jgi:hypothetical protein